MVQYNLMRGRSSAARTLPCQGRGRGCESHRPLQLYTITGIVKKGEKRGKILGYPTANIPPSPEAAEGIYVSTTQVNGKDLPSITFIGASQTFGQTAIQCETYILNFSGNLYGKKITVHCLQKIRENKKFNSADALVRQIEKDVYTAKKYFSLNPISSPE